MRRTPRGSSSEAFKVIYSYGGKVLRPFLFAMVFGVYTQDNVLYLGDTACVRTEGNGADCHSPAALTIQSLASIRAEDGAGRGITLRGKPRRRIFSRFPVG